MPSVASTLRAAKKWTSCDCSRKNRSNLLCVRKPLTGKPAESPYQGLAEDIDIIDGKNRTEALNKELLDHFRTLAASNMDTDQVDLQFLESLITDGADVNTADKYGQTALHEISRAWNVNVMKFFLEKGADIHHADSYGVTPLHVAAALDYEEMVELLIERKASLGARTVRDLQTPLHFAAKNDAVGALKILLKHGADISSRDYKQRTPLHLAANLDRSEAARALMELGADAGVRDDDGQLCITAMIGRMAPVARLALNQFHVKDRVTRQQFYYLNLVEPQAPSKTGQHAKKCKENEPTSPLEVIVKQGKLDLIMHPVILKLIKVKWNLYGRLGAWILLLLNFLFILSWTIVAISVALIRPEELPYAFPGVRQKMMFHCPVALLFGQQHQRVAPNVNSNAVSSINIMKIKMFHGLADLFVCVFTEECPPPPAPPTTTAKCSPRGSSLTREFCWQDWWRVLVIVVAIVLTVLEVCQELAEMARSRGKMSRWQAWYRDRITADKRCLQPMWPEERYFLEEQLKAILKMRPNYFQDLWNVFDWLVYLLLMVVFGIHVADIFINNVSLRVNSLRLFAVTLIFLWLRLMKHVRAFRVMGPFIVMLGKIVGDVFRFLFLYAEFYVPYACAFWIIFGGTATIPSMETVPKLLYSLYRITLVDDYEFEAMVSVDPIMAYLLCGTFLGLSAILCVNLLIALLSETFQRVYDNATANAVMQQASIILLVEDSMPCLRRFYDPDHIHKHCAPLVEFCDDDITTNKDDDAEMKKVTVQIKEALDDFLESKRDGSKPDDETTDTTEGAQNISKMSSVIQMQRECLRVMKDLQMSQSKQNTALLSLEKEVHELQVLLQLLIATPGSCEILSKQSTSISQNEKKAWRESTAETAQRPPEFPLMTAAQNFETVDMSLQNVTQEIAEQMQGVYKEHAF
ncbi:transient receptor potential channel pyrexia [Lepisosteus oculatus]|uniref:transient receptor potential channel pyrexia n=1 Tax=Lepisosteus oculatus TaxID=7918 RepID=UPI0035F51728